MNDPRGSIWRKWDLHIHTPLSIFQNYGGDTKVNWDKFVAKLENLPNDVKVIGINDYYFIDGYEKLMLNYKLKGRLKNIDKIFPLLEFRIDTFGTASESKFQKINLHILFDLDEEKFKNEIDDIRKEFINLIPLTKLERHKTKILSKKNLISECSDKTLSKGFEELIPSTEKVFEILSSDKWKNKVFKLLGYKEWNNLEKGKQLKQFKNDLYKKADAFFTATKDDNFTKKREILEIFGNKPLIHSMDIHCFDDFDKYDCKTWIKADQTFNGLKQILIEPTDRIFIGEMPDSILRVKEDPTKYIKEVKIGKVDGSSLDEIWFDELKPIELNSELVSIIGNKGSGKSALADTIGLLGNTHNKEGFTFLCDTKFKRKRPNKSESFYAILKWENGVEEASKFLSEDTDISLSEKVKYIPQNYLESLCTETDEKKFSEELKKVIFSHVDDSEKLDKHSLDELMDFKSEEINRGIGQIQREIADLNKKIAELESKKTPEYRSKIENALKIKKEELDAHKKNKPKAIKEPTKDKNVKKEQIQINSTLVRLKSLSTELNNQIIAKKACRKNSALKLASVQRFEQSMINFKNQYKLLKEQYESELKEYKIDFNKIVKLTIGNKLITDEINETKKVINQIDDELNPSIVNSTADKYLKNTNKIKKLQGKLDEPARKFQDYNDKLEQWINKKKIIIGNSKEQNTIKFFEGILKYLDNEINIEIEYKKSERSKKVDEIYQRKIKIVKLYKDLYSPITQFISEYGDLMKDYRINMDVSTQLDNFEDKFFNIISRGLKGSFIGTNDGIKTLRNITDGVDFNSDTQLKEFHDSIILHLVKDQRKDFKDKDREIIKQLREGYEVQDFYNFLYNIDYLKPNYKLKLGIKEISELSPGERGALLLIFYLLIDKQDIPLIIDQPEENLDNQSVYNTLVKFIKEAKKRRQIIIVTHNPNLAVVCDAEQIIRVKIEKDNKNKFSLVSGAIENPLINKNIVEILEGTFPAFDNRTEKYKVTKR